MIPTTSVTFSLRVGDLMQAARWYQHVLEADPDIEPVEGILEYEVHPGCWLQIATGKQDSGGAVLRLGVATLEETHKRLSDKGISIGAIERIDGVIVYFDVADPWNNQLSFYQLLAEL